MGLNLPLHAVHKLYIGDASIMHPVKTTNVHEEDMGLSCSNHIASLVDGLPSSRLSGILVQIRGCWERHCVQLLFAMCYPHPARWTENVAT